MTGQAHHAMPFRIDYPSSIECLREFYAHELRKETAAGENDGQPSDGLERIREEFSEYPQILERLHGSKIEPSLPSKNQGVEENQLLNSLNSESGKLSAVTQEISRQYPDFENKSFANLCALTRYGLAHVYKQLAVHPDAVIAKVELQAFCLELSRINELPPSSIPTSAAEQIYLQNIRERYFSALCIYQITCHGGSCTRQDFAEKFEALSLHHKRKSEEALINLLDSMNLKLS